MLPDRPIDWRDRTVSPAQAVECVRPGDRVFVGSACATPRTLLGALEKRSHLVAGAQLIHFLTGGASASDSSYLRHRTFYVGTADRPLATEGRADYVPVSLTELSALIRNG